MGRDCLSGPRCCTGECADVTYLPPFAEFPLAEGTAAADRWQLADGDRLRPPAAVASSAEAWFHTIQLKAGDVDLQWDGLTIQYRSGPGTISVDGHDSIVVPADELADGWAEGHAAFGMYLTLYVTPQWYSVWLAPWRQLGFESTDSRGSIQTIERDNTDADKSVVLVAVGDAEVASWRFADATVTEQDEGLAQCSRPDRRPACTERYHQSRIAYEASATITAGIDSYKVVTGSPLPACTYESSEEITFAVGDPESGNYPNCIRQFFPIGDIDNPVSESYIRLLASTSGAATSRLPNPTIEQRYPRPHAIVGFGLLGDYDGDAVSVNVDYLDDGAAPAQATLKIAGQVAAYFAEFTPEACVAGYPIGWIHRFLDSAEAELWIE